MSKIKLHFYEVEAKDKLAKVETDAKRLQAIHDQIISLGAVDLDIEELKNIVDSDSGHVGALNIRRAILKDKKLEISGLQIDPSTIQLPEKKISTLVLEARKVNPGRGIAWRHLTVNAGTVVVTEAGKQEITESCTVYGSQKAEKVIKMVDKLSSQANAICKEIGATTFSPLRTPESWIVWNVDEQKFEADFLKLAAFIK